MKILFILNSGYKEAGGVETTVASIAEHLLKRGQEAKVLTSDIHSTTDTMFNDYEYPALPTSGLKKIIYTAFNPGAYKVTKKTLEEFKPDVVMVHTMYQPTAAILFLLAKYPTILFVHGPELYTKSWVHWYVSAKHFRHGNQERLRDLDLVGSLHYIYFRYVCTSVYKFGLRNVDKFVALSSFTNSHLKKEGINATYFPTGIELFDCAPLKKDKRTILYVGRLEGYKGVDDLIKAMPRTLKSFPGARLRIAGVGNNRAALEELVECMNVKNKVTFLGQLTREQLEKEYGNCTLLVMPSKYPETFGKVGVEAMSVGRPVIATDVGGVRDWLKDGVNGFLVQPNSPDQIAEKAISIFSNVDTSRKMSAAARKTAEEFSADRLTDHVEEMAQSILGLYSI